MCENVAYRNISTAGMVSELVRAQMGGIEHEIVVIVVLRHFYGPFHLGKLGVGYPRNPTLCETVMYMYVKQPFWVSGEICNIFPRSTRPSQFFLCALKNIERPGCKASSSE